MFPFFAEVSVFRYKTLIYWALPTDTPGAGCRWGVTLYDRYPSNGVSVDNTQEFSILRATTDTHNLKRQNIFFGQDTEGLPCQGKNKIVLLTEIL